MASLFSWVAENPEVTGVAVNFIFVVIWGVYLQLIHKTFREQRRPRVIINQSLGYGSNSLCTLSNMSREPVHISCVLLSVYGGEAALTTEVTDYMREHSQEEDLLDPRKGTKLGPLSSGGFLSLGTFQSLLELALAS
jgi:hypothetical protein